MTVQTEDPCRAFSIRAADFYVHLEALMGPARTELIAEINSRPALSWPIVAAEQAVDVAAALMFRGEALLADVERKFADLEAAWQRAIGTIHAAAFEPVADVHP